MTPRITTPAADVWLDRTPEQEAVETFFPDAAHGVAGDAGARVLIVDAPPGHGAGTLVALAASRAREQGWRVVHARPRPGPDGSTLLPDLGGRPGRALRGFREPTVVVLDDAHRVPAAEERLLREVLRRAAPRPLLTVIRTWRAGVDLPAAAARVVRPGRWDAGVIARSTGIPPERAASLVEAAGGIPAVLVPIVLDLRRGIEVTEESVATARRRFDADALAMLPPDAERLAAAMAVSAGALPLDLLGALVGLPGPLVRRAARILASAGLTESGSAPGRPERLPGPRLRDDGVVERVLAGVPVTVGIPLATFALRAADRAHRHGAPDELVGRILRPVSTPPAWAVPVLVRAAGAATAAGDPWRAQDHLAVALRGDAEGEQRDRLRLGAAEVLVVGHPELSDRRLVDLVLTGETADVRVRAADQLVMRCSTRAARVALSRALHAPGRDGNERWTLQALYWSSRGSDRADTDVDESAVDPLPELPPDPARAGVAALAAAKAGGPRSRARVRALARTALGPAGDRPGPVVPRVAAARALTLAEDHDEARVALDVLAAEDRVLCSPVLAAAVRIALTELELHRGRLGPARIALRSALDTLPPPSWHPDALGLAQSLPVQLALAEGLPERAAQELAAVDVPGEGWSRGRLGYVRGLTELATGRPADAVVTLRASGRDLAAHGLMNPSTRPWRSFTALALANLGRWDEALRPARREVELAREWGSEGALGWSLAVQGLVSGRPGAGDVRDGIALLHRCGLGHRAALAMTLAARGGHPDAPEMLRHAASLADEAGALARAERLRALIAADDGGGS